MSISDELDQLSKAIEAVETGSQEYRIGNRSLKRADLATLYKERQALKTQLNQEQNNGNITVARFSGR